MRFADTATPTEIDRFDELIDVRSPAEYAEDHVPGAANHPVLDDAERAEVGTLYKQVSPFAAKVRGATLVARNIARHVETTFCTRPKDWRPLVYCWRGGKRSAALKHVLREIGWQAATLEGGYKAFRREVVTQLESLPAELRYVVICGETGSAKSRVLSALAARGEQVLDLEAHANHRGSVLGASPEGSQPSQKMFETRVWNRLRSLDPARSVFVESESKKVGELHVPDALMRAMRASPCVRIDAPLAARVEFLLREYAHFVRDPALLGARLDALDGMVPREMLMEWKALASDGAWRPFVGALLEHHYDPAYRRSMERNFAGLVEARVVSADSLDDESIGRIAEAIADDARVPSQAV